MKRPVSALAGQPDATAGAPMTDDARRRTGWRMVATGFVSQSCASYFSIATYGAVMPTLQQELGTTRAMASLAMGLMLVALGVASPIVGILLQRVSLRNAMTAGAAVSAVGYVLLAYATSIWQVLAVYALLIGPCACLLGALGISTLVSRWFDEERGKALAIVNVPAFLLIAQPIAAQLVIHGGRKLSFLALAAVFVLLVPLMRTIVDWPGRGDQVPATAAVDASGGGGAAPDGYLHARDIFGDARFWMLSLAVGVLTGCGSAFLAHVAAIAISKGVPLAAASTLLSFYGGGAIVGAFAFGWLADRKGPFVALIVNTVIQATVWAAFAIVTDLTLLWACSALVGVGMGALVALHSTAINQLFGVRNFSRVMGFGYLLKMPFLLACAPLAGFVLDVSGSYAYALLGGGIAIMGAGVVFAMMQLSMRLRVASGMLPAR